MEIFSVSDMLEARHALLDNWCQSLGHNLCQAGSRSSRELLSLRFGYLSN
jgi:hypothetical protein